MRGLRGMGTKGVVLGAALALSACGGARSPEDTVEEFAQAAADGDYEQVCALMDPTFVEAAEEGSDGDSCEDAMRATAEEEESGALIADVDQLEIGDASVAEDEQTASVPTTYDGNESEIQLVKVDDEWRVTLETS